MPGMLGVVVAVVGSAAVLLTAMSFLARPRRSKHRPTSGSAGSGALGELVEVFQPSRHHLVEEMQRQEHDVVQSPSADPGIDLDAGTAVVRPAPAGPRAPDAGGPATQTRP